MNIQLDVQDFETQEGGETITRSYVTLRAYEELVGEIGSLRKDLIELRKNKALLDSEVVELATIRAQHRQMMDEQNELALFLREHYKDEIALGQHGGMTLVQVIQKYLGRERIYARDQVRSMIPEPARVAKIRKKAGSGNGD